MAGAVLSALNGAAHFALPFVYPTGGWVPHVEGLYEPVRWALYATTVFLGLLLVLGGALTVVLARSADVPRRVVGRTMGGMAAFWLVAAGYEMAVPYPIPEARVALPAFSVTVAVLYLGGLALRWSPGRVRPRARRGAEAWGLGRPELTSSERPSGSSRSGRLAAGTPRRVFVP